MKTIFRYLKPYMQTVMFAMFVKLAGTSMELLIPSVMLRHEQDLFLDDVSLKELEERLQVPVTVVGEDGAELLERLLGRGE